MSGKDVGAVTWSDTPQVGDRIAPHLTLRSVLGKGGGATVFEAFHERLQAAVAVKVSMVTGPRAKAAETRLVREAQLCARVDDPRVARVYDIADLADGRPYFVMERVIGTTLATRLLDGPTAPETAVDITRQLLRVLISTHAQGVVHCDLKPENVILQGSSDGTELVRLLDFGIAVAADDEPRQPGDVDRPKLQGTPGYMSPEQIGGEPVDGRADVYALGIVLYEMLSGRLPSEEPDPVRLLYVSLAHPVPDVRGHAPECPAELAEWLMRATAQEASDRFASAAEALQELASLGLGRESTASFSLPPQASMPPPATSSSPRSPASRMPTLSAQPRLYASLAACGLVAAMTLGWALTGSTPEQAEHAAADADVVDGAPSPVRAAPLDVQPEAVPARRAEPAAPAAGADSDSDSESMPQYAEVQRFAPSDPSAALPSPDSVPASTAAPVAHDVEVSEAAVPSPPVEHAAAAVADPTEDAPRHRHRHRSRERVDADVTQLMGETLPSLLENARAEWSEALQVAEAPALGIPSNPYPDDSLATQEP